MVNIEIKGVDEVISNLRDIDNKIKEQVGTGIKEATLFMQNEVKLSIAGQRNEPTSVDTGRLLNSVDLTTSKTEGKVFTDVPYGKFIEFGTSKLSPRRHFRNSLARNQQKINQIIKEEIKKIN